MELYGLVSVIDGHHFGDAKSFRAQYARLVEGGRFDDLKVRLEPVCHRTLRRHVVEYVRYTNRVPITQEFWPTPDEQELYDLASDYLRRPELQALPSAQRTLMVLVMRKLLASSTFAIAGALDSLARKLARQLRDDDAARAEAEGRLEQELAEDCEELDETADEWEDEPDADRVTLLTETQRRALADERWRTSTRGSRHPSSPWRRTARPGPRSSGSPIGSGTPRRRKRSHVGHRVVHQRSEGDIRRQVLPHQDLRRPRLTCARTPL